MASVVASDVTVNSTEFLNRTFVRPFGLDANAAVVLGAIWQSRLSACSTSQMFAYGPMTSCLHGEIKISLFSSECLSTQVDVCSFPIPATVSCT